MRSYFYDIESLTNVFTLANFRKEDNVVEMYYLCDDPSLIPDNFEALATQRIHKRNKNFNGTVEFYDLHKAESNFKLAMTFGLSDARYINNPNQRSSYSPDYRLVCDTDPNYDEDVHPYFFGYNSFNYDTTMYVLYIYDAIDDKDG